MVHKSTMVRCGKCNMLLDERPNVGPEKRKPCSSCGSISRLFAVTIESSIQIHSGLAYKARRGGKRRPFLEGFSGASLSRKLQKWMRLERVIDREKDFIKK